ncbi:MAG TPA: aromatic ring-hydroxylating dioxygenase subunit alpha [Microlunatus sp.]|jgi:vanillate O-demethylase monooxygenase subunit|nr:aromatic ring-hydroxylating dioxygenase subunit alpha [Microlunatus sp.]
MTRTHPHNSWYALAASDEVGRDPLGRRALDTGVVLFRTTDGAAVALEDRCVHRPYPLSRGWLDGDTIVSGYSGFTYDARGFCVRVPTQDEIPVGARVRGFPVHDDGVFVWVWLGEPSLAALRTPPVLGWLDEPGWVTVGDTWETAADLALLHENFADITHVAVVDPFIAPPVLRNSPPPLEVEVTETTVAFSRTYAKAPIAAWQAELAGLDPDASHVQRERGMFASPGVWVDSWDVEVEGGTPPVLTFRFTHAVTPIAAGRTRHAWRVSRNFALGEQASKVLVPIFTEYYRRVQSILETMQQVIDSDGPRREVNVSADAAALQVRKIIRSMVADETGTPVRRGPRAAQRR